MNGGWLDATEIPADRVWYGAFEEIQDRTEHDLRTLIEDLAATPQTLRGPSRQIVDLYLSMMDEAHVERRGAAPPKPQLDRIAAIGTKRAFAAEAGHLSAIGFGGLFDGTVAADAATGVPIVQIRQGGTFLPDREYYLSGNPTSAELRGQYRNYLGTIFRLADRPHAEADAAAVVAFETLLARVQEPPGGAEEGSSLSAIALADLRRVMPGFDWLAWARPQGIDRTPALVFSHPGFFKAFAAIVEQTPLETLKAWLAARYLTAAAPFVSAAFGEARFALFGRSLTGQELPRERWKRGVSLVNGYLGDALGRLYVARHFPAAARPRVETLVRHLVEACRRSIAEAAWMAPATRRHALEKLSRLRTKIGYPSSWRSYNGLVIRRDDLFGNIHRARQFDNAFRMARLDHPSESQDEWLITPQTPNAYYSPALNEIGLPAAMLQPPFFMPEAEDAVNYGAIGAIVGHELAHGFDEGGRRYDADRMARDWWTEPDERAFRARAEAIVRQFEGYRPVGDLRIDGRLTLAENIADLMGLAIAYRAYELSRSGRPAPVLDGFTGEQRFFLAWARIWRSKERPEYLRQRLATMPYAPSRYRANGPVTHLQAFHDAFGVRPGDGLYRDQAFRIVFW